MRKNTKKAQSKKVDKVLLKTAQALNEYILEPEDALKPDQDNLEKEIKYIIEDGLILSSDLKNFSKDVCEKLKELGLKDNDEPDDEPEDEELEEDEDDEPDDEPDEDDDEPDDEPDDEEELTIPEVKKFCKDFGIPVQGLKTLDDFAEKIREYEFDTNVLSDDDFRIYNALANYNIENEPDDEDEEDEDDEENADGEEDVDDDEDVEDDDEDEEPEDDDEPDEDDDEDEDEPDEDDDEDEDEPDEVQVCPHCGAKLIVIEGEIIMKKATAKKTPSKKATAKKTPSKKAAVKEKTPSKKAAVKGGTTNRKAPKREGVISSIIEILEKSGKKGITPNEMLEKMEKRFPDRDPKSMMNTIKIQLGGRLKNDKGYNIIKTDKGRYLIK